MIPQGGSLTNASVQEVQQPSRTWKMDFEKGCITGQIDGLDSVKQAVFKVLQTDRFWYNVYSFNYGHELGPLIGKSPLYVRSEVSRKISEALLQDDRIQAIDGLDIEYLGDEMIVRFVVVTKFGNFEQEVRRSV